MATTRREFIGDKLIALYEDLKGRYWEIQNYQGVNLCSLTYLYDSDYKGGTWAVRINGQVGVYRPDLLREILAFIDKLNAEGLPGKNP